MYVPYGFGPAVEPIRSQDSSKAQLENLDEGTLAQLLAMLAETKQGGAPAN